MRDRQLTQWLLLLFLAVPGLALSQRAQQGRTLVIVGQPGQAPVVQLNGRSLVDIETLARLTHGTLSFKGTQILLTLPGAPTASAVAAPQAAGQAPASSAATAPALGFSKGFLNASIETLGLIREWRTALAQAVQNAAPVTGDLISGYNARAATSRRLASVAVATPDDRKADLFLGNEFNNMQALSQRFIDAHIAQQYQPPDSLEGDPAFQKILMCASAIAAMQSNNQFQDDNSCH